MKKLLTAAVASTFAFLAMGVVNGDEINQGADFEASDFVSGEAFNAALDDEAGAYGDKFWYTEDTEADNIISNYPSTGTGVPIASRPDKFASNSNSKYLRVETTGKLWRSVKNNGGSSDFLTNTTASLDVYGYSITNSAIYLDTLVKFTPADGEFAADALSDGDKIAISYVEHEADTDGDVSYTNFVIRAGLINGSELFQTNYFAYLPDDPTFANFDKDAWHRLTVRTIPDVGDGSVGFVVYVDETNLTYAVGVDAGFGTLNATAQGFYNGEKHALFPSARKAGAIGGKTISAASFSGNGSIDDVVFTTTTPGFIESSESVVATITLETGISSVTVSVAGEPVAPVDATASPLVFNLAPGTTTFTLAVTADSANGYSFDAATGITAENASYDNGTVTISGGAPTLTLKATRNNVTYIDGDNNPTSCVSLAAAIAGAKAGSTITLAYSINVADVEGAGFETYEVASGKNLVLDLNGNTISWNDEQGEEALFSIKSGASFRVIDSSVANTGAIVYTGEYVVFYNKGDCYIGATTGDNGPTIQGKLAASKAEPQIVRGKFDKAKNTTSTAFTWTDYIEEGSALGESAGDYWIVAPTGGGDEDWPTGTDLDDLEGQKVSDIYSGISADFDKVDAKTFVTWASGVGDVAYADKGSTTFNIDCFLLNIANDSTPAEIAAATATAEEAIKITAITFDASGNPVITAPASYGNGVVVIEGSVSLDPISWHEKDDGDHFFHAKLVVDEVVTP